MDMKAVTPGSGKVVFEIARPAVMTTALMLVQTIAQAQPEPAADSGSGLQTWLLRILIVLVVAAAGVGIYMFTKNRKQKPWEGFYSEPETKSSKFEQLLAEIQGLSLRVQGGESKGYYRKIEVLIRVYLERIGCEDARQLDDDELDDLIKKASIPHGQADQIRSILERARTGAKNESSKLDFTAAELLKDIRKLIVEVDDMPEPRPQNQN